MFQVREGLKNWTIGRQSFKLLSPLLGPAASGSLRPTLWRSIAGEAEQRRDASAQAVLAGHENEANRGKQRPLSRTRVLRQVREMLKTKYQAGEVLNLEDQKFIEDNILAYHPKREEKIGPGLANIKVDKLRKRGTVTKCFFVCRVDGSSDDFSYLKYMIGEQKHSSGRRREQRGATDSSLKGEDRGQAERIARENFQDTVGIGRGHRFPTSDSFSSPGVTLGASSSSMERTRNFEDSNLFLDSVGGENIKSGTGSQQRRHEGVGFLGEKARIEWRNSKPLVGRKAKLKGQDGQECVVEIISIGTQAADF